MNVIQTELSEAIADLAAKCPGADIHVAVHSAPFEVFASDDVKDVRVVNSGGRSWLHARATAADYRIELYSADLPKPPTDDADVIPL